MHRYLYLTVLPALLLGCQSNNPYQAESVPLPPAPASAAEHFDASSYPVILQPQDYNYWCWPNLVRQSLPAEYTEGTAQQVLAEQLEQYGLRPAASAEQCQLQVQLTSQQRNQAVRYDYYPSAYYGYGYGRGDPFYDRYDRYRHSGLGINIPITPRSYTEYYVQLQLSFIDAQTGQTVWRGHNTLSSDRYGATSEQALRQAINDMLNSYF